MSSSDLGLTFPFISKKKKKQFLRKEFVRVSLPVMQLLCWLRA